MLIVMEGDLLTLEVAATAVENGTPVIMMNGSGRAADIASYAYYKHT